MKFALITLAVLCLVALIAWRPSRPEPRLQGTWRSNKEETVAVWRREGVIRDKIIDQFEKVGFTRFDGHLGGGALIAKRP